MLKVAIIGCGGLGSALARGLAEAPWVTLTVCDKHPEKVEHGTFVADPADAARGADVVVLAVKPPAAGSAADAIAGAVGSSALVVSCAAGVSLAKLEQHITQAALARAMPNTGAGVKAATTAVVLGARTEEARDLGRLQGVFGAVGEVRMLAREELMHAATALVGSGPAFVLLALESLMDAGVAMGFARADAEALARGALRAASALADEGSLSPAELRARITSPGGTTAAGLGALERAGARAAFWDAVKAATERSRELG